jgi:hypothetical protein
VTSYKSNIFLLPAKSVTSLIGLSILEDYDPLFSQAKKEETATESVNTTLQVFPNPTRGTFYIEGNNTTKLEVYDLSGKLVHQNRLKPGRNSISVNNLSPGIYMAKIYSKEGISTRKIIVMR